MSEISERAEVLIVVIGDACRDGDRAQNLAEYIASLEAQLATSELQSQLAATQARLAGFEVGYEPMVQLPDDGVTVWIAMPIVDGYSYDEAFWDDDRWQSATRAYTAWELERVERWFPLPRTKEDE